MIHDGITLKTVVLHVNPCADPVLVRRDRRVAVDGIAEFRLPEFAVLKGRIDFTEGQRRFHPRDAVRARHGEIEIRIRIPVSAVLHRPEADGRNSDLNERLGVVRRLSGTQDHLEDIPAESLHRTFRFLHGSGLGKSIGLEQKIDLFAVMLHAQETFFRDHVSGEKLLVQGNLRGIVPLAGRGGAVHLHLRVKFRDIGTVGGRRCGNLRGMAEILGFDFLRGEDVVIQPDFIENRRIIVVLPPETVVPEPEIETGRKRLFVGRKAVAEKRRGLAVQEKLHLPRVPVQGHERPFVPGEFFLVMDVVLGGQFLSGKPREKTGLRNPAASRKQQIISNAVGAGPAQPEDRAELLAACLPIQRLDPEAERTLHGIHKPGRGIGQRIPGIHQRAVSGNPGRPVVLGVLAEG